MREAEIAGGEPGFAADVRVANQCVQSERGIALKDAEPVMDEDAVLAFQRDEIADGRKRRGDDGVEKHRLEFVGDLVAAAQDAGDLPRQFVRHSRSAKVRSRSIPIPEDKDARWRRRREVFPSADGGQ